MCLLRISAPLWSFSWRRNGKYYNVARDSQASMRRRSGTLDIYAWNNPEQYEAEYQCIASNEYGSAYSNKIRLRLYSKITTEALSGPANHYCCCTDSRHTMASVSRVTHTFFCQYLNTLKQPVLWFYTDGIWVLLLLLLLLLLYLISLYFLLNTVLLQFGHAKTTKIPVFFKKISYLNAVHFKAEHLFCGTLFTS